MQTPPPPPAQHTAPAMRPRPPAPTPVVITGFSLGMEWVLLAIVVFLLFTVPATCLLSMFFSAIMSGR